MLRKVLTLVICLTLPVIFAPAAASQEYFQSETRFWVDCSLGSRTTDCVESVEFSDPTKEKRDANGQLDYSSIVWIKTTPKLNSKFVYKKTAYSASDFGNYDSKTCESIGNSADFLHDACYTASGLLSDGKDLLFRLQIGSSGPFFNIYQWVDQGVQRNWDRGDWVAQTVPDGSTWRITLKSKSLAQNAGAITSNMKNPYIAFGRSTDGDLLTYIQGTVYPNQWQCLSPDKPNATPAERGELCKHPESYAETASTGFSIDVMPYVFQFEKLRGYTPGGIFVSGPTGSLGQVQYDKEQGVITVPMSGPHFLFDRKTLNKGWMEVSIKGDIIRQAFNLEPKNAGQLAKVEISYVEGKADIATYATRYIPELDTFEIRAYNFGFSAPTLRVKMPPAKPTQSTQSTSKKAPSKITSITCVKGKTIKTIKGNSPKCPSGYVKR
ncbi:unannotated protein [freshwater metagenome]|uniref:Unannotated protein n=1 Tax=freshwater metagenome TaxID=449393 RepID=A0A6J7T4R2_9ZZZZ|nr:hypothetical protein [Actinomycetota bacterium]